MAALAWILLALVAGATVYSALVVAAALTYLRSSPVGQAFPPAQAGQRVCPTRNPEPISILKPLAGLDEGLEENLRSFFRQDYPEFELLFAVRDASDPAAAVVDRLRADFPKVAARLVLIGEPPWANPKCCFLDRMLAQARYALIVMSDSDTLVGPDLLAMLAAEFEDPDLGLASCPYRVVGGRPPVGHPAPWVGDLAPRSPATDSKILKTSILSFGPIAATMKSTISRHRLISIPGDGAQPIASPSE